MPVSGQNFKPSDERKKDADEMVPKKNADAEERREVGTSEEVKEQKLEGVADDGGSKGVVRVFREEKPAEEEKRLVREEPKTKRGENARGKEAQKRKDGEFDAERYVEEMYKSVCDYFWKEWEGWGAEAEGEGRWNDEEEEDYEENGSSTSRTE